MKIEFSNWRWSRLSVGCLFVLLPLWGIAAVDAAPEQNFIWQQANAQAAAAVSAADWRRAALTYQQLTRADIRDGVLFYNLGVAWLQAGEYAAAVSALQKAECFLGNDPDVTRNLTIALARRAGRDNAEYPWYRFLFAWHFNLSMPRRLQIAVVSFFCVWIGLILIRLGFSRIGKSILPPILLVWAAFFSSWLASLYCLLAH